MTYLLIAIGGAIGSVARFICAGWVMTSTASSFPWGTIAVNVVGSGLIGGLAAMSGDHRWPLSADARNFMMVGVMGGFTTFSSFSLQTFELLRTQQWLQASANVLISVVLCLGSVAFGYWLISSLGQPK
jgi:fluoride exporter